MKGKVATIEFIRFKSKVVVGRTPYWRPKKHWKKTACYFYNQIQQQYSAVRQGCLIRSWWPPSGYNPTTWVTAHHPAQLRRIFSVSCDVFQMHFKICWTDSESLRSSPPRIWWSSHTQNSREIVIHTLLICCCAAFYCFVWDFQNHFSVCLSERTQTIREGTCTIDMILSGKRKDQPHYQHCTMFTPNLWRNIL